MGLRVIALISGGKDSFLCALKCMELGHRIVALANLHPAAEKRILPVPGGGGAGDDRPAGADASGTTGDFDEEEEDLNSFMYQTVGHEIIPLYAQATGLPLYREPIVGRAVQDGRDYASPQGDDSSSGDDDETESMTRLLRRICKAHPDANAVCSGAILSTYQRTRVESVAGRLGLVSLAFCWQYPRLPVESQSSAALGATSTQSYFSDLSSSSFRVHIIKVASGGLDDYESFLWGNICDPAFSNRLLQALGRFTNPGGGLCDSATGLGEGGEYETLVMDGPAVLFRNGFIRVADGDWRVVDDSGGTAWIQIRKAEVVPRPFVDRRPDGAKELQPGELDTSEQAMARPPKHLMDKRFGDILNNKNSGGGGNNGSSMSKEAGAASLQDGYNVLVPPSRTLPSNLVTWSVIPATNNPSVSITDAAQSIVAQVRRRLAAAGGLPATRHVLRTLVVLRSMGDFPVVNSVYATLFSDGEPNPPARVCIASGNDALLPDGVDVAVFLSVLVDPQRMLQRAPSLRQGLHVQSRSYWAPANIGPYSQAVSIPLGCLVGSSDEDTASSDGPLPLSSSPRIVFIAGQIPLVPATMDMADRAAESLSCPLLSETGADPHTAASFGFQATFALQHLWRIAEERGVQWWTSAVLYVPRHGTSTAEDDTERGVLSQKAVQAARIWQLAHDGSADDDNDEDDENEQGGPDLWDRTYNAQYRTYGGAGGIDDDWPLPNWEMLAEDGRTATAKPVPPMFLAEVEELPRGAAAEWHVQSGFSNLAAASVRCGVAHDTPSSFVHHTVVQIPAEASYDDDDDDDDSDKEDSNNKSSTKIRRSICQTAQSWVYHADKKLPASAWTANAAAGSGPPPDTVYADLRAVDGLPSALLADGVAVVPCVSLWSEQGVRLAAVAVTTSVVEQEERTRTSR